MFNTPPKAQDTRLVLWKKFLVLLNPTGRNVVKQADTRRATQVKIVRTLRGQP